MEKIKEDFLTIPDAPNYEINSQLLVRNKKTGRILKESLTQRKVHLRVEGTPIQRHVKSLRCKAVDAIQGGSWLPVPSLEYRYEVNQQGDLRNARSKKYIKLIKEKSYYVCVNGKTRNVSKTSLLWECHGIVPKQCRGSISITIFKGDVRLHFKNLKSAAEYLSPKVYYPVKSLRTYFSSRISELGGWKFTYHLSQDLTTVTDTVGDWAKCKKPKNGTWLKTGVITAEV